VHSFHRGSRKIEHRGSARTPKEVEAIVPVQRSGHESRACAATASERQAGQPPLTQHEVLCRLGGVLGQVGGDPPPG
jgi:hypothetical protein